jgi:thioesterase domain-containing protein
VSQSPPIFPVSDPVGAMKSRHGPRAVAVLLAVLCQGAFTRAADLDDERDIAEQIAARTSPQEVIQLDVSGIAFQGLFRETTTKDRRGGVIVLPGRQSNQDSAELVRPLRTELPKHGWSSLSLSLPAADTEAEAQDFSALLPEATARLRSGVLLLKQKNIAEIALIGHDTGAWVALNYLLQQPDPAVKAVVLIDPAPTRSLPAFPVTLEKLGQTRTPILDILSNRENAAVADEARERRAALKENWEYRQVVINAPHERWQDMEDYLINRIYGWLARMKNMVDSMDGKPVTPAQSADQPVSH